MYYLQYCLFTSGGGVDDVLVRLALVAQFIQDANLMCISSSVKLPETFRESCSNLQSHYTFFQVHQIGLDIVPILYSKQ